VRTFTLRAAETFDADVLRSRLEAFLDRHGSAIVRMKGLLPVEGRPGPAVVQAAAGQLYPVRLLSRWPEGATGALVIVAKGLNDAQARAALEELASAGS
jgi:G3E family GTPase